jgi:hypothetical protein
VRARRPNSHAPESCWRALPARLVGSVDPGGSLPLRIGAGRDNARRRGAQSPVSGLFSPRAPVTPQLQSPIRCSGTRSATQEQYAPLRLVRDLLLLRARVVVKTSAARAFSELDVDERCAAFSTIGEMLPSRELYGARFENRVLYIETARSCGK